MNDPELDTSIGDAAKDIEKDPYQKAEKQEEEEEEDFLDPSRWWLASTAIPLIAGTFGPMANAFSICALVSSWRESFPDGGTEAHGDLIKDPGWLLGINSVSLVLALVANSALLLNMARRISFAVGQSITIVGWLLASALLIALVAVASTSTFRINPPQNHALTQAFYYAVIAAALYFIISALMMLTVYGAFSHHYDREFRLTTSQRTLMLQTIMFMFYLLLGALVFAEIEGWAYLDAVYWADFTLLTVGVGADFVPKTHLGRSLLFPYAIGGILTVGLVVGSVRSLVLERGKHKMEARMTEKTRQQVLKSASSKNDTMRIGLFHKARLPDVDPDNEYKRREREFHIMRQIQDTSASRRRWISFGTSFVAAMTLWLLGAFVFMKAEHGQEWSYFVSLYFSYTSLLTIGYGDLQPTSNSGKPFFVFWSLLAVPTLTILISNMGDTVVKGFSDLTIWLGSLTILPDEHGLREGVKLNIRRIKRDGPLRSKDLGFQEAPGFVPHADSHNEHHSSPEADAFGRMSKYIEEEELIEARKASEHHDKVERDIHFYHYVLVKEIRKVMKDVSASPPKKYEYRDWAYFLKLMGEEENDASRHRRPRLEPERHNGVLENRMDRQNTSEQGKDSEKWSWMGTRSPLMGNKSEAEWLLEKLSSCLENEIRNMRDPGKGGRKPPPVSMDDLVRMEGRNGRESSESGTKKDV